MLTAEILPGKGLGPFILGASLHDVLTRCKAQPQTYPKLDLSYSSSQPVSQPIVLGLPANGLRFRFDGPDQRLRLIEVLDFSKSQLTYKDQDLVKVGGSPTTEKPTGVTGPNFRHVYRRLFGLSFPGEYVPPTPGSGSGKGTYILSYPGIAFSFPLQHSAWSPEVDFVDLLLSSSSSPATSMAIFDGESWPQSRGILFNKPPSFPRSSTLALGGKEVGPDEIEKIVVHDQGRLELVRRSSTPFWIILNETSPQELVAELGPPDAIYRKNDRRMSIHRKQSAGSRDQSRPRGHSFAAMYDDSTDTDRSSTTAATEDSDVEDDFYDHEGAASPECFYNYFHHGFDVFISFPATRSPPWGGSAPDEPAPITNRLTTSKLIIHGNIPGSYPFNRHRRSRWVLDFGSNSEASMEGSLESSEQNENGNAPNVTLDSETPFPGISSHLKAVWKDFYGSKDEEMSSQRGMVLNRGWGNSPGSSCELLGGWEDGEAGPSGEVEPTGTAEQGQGGLGNTELFGFPGMIFEVLKNNAVSSLTLY
ncbi:MAG: hypothetical protein M1834_003602 [Cirrosporium novae-zelandiae]|nr:MAG: hypothetical protein M1834_003602 [Cirrosporium novae-zelandiae]